MTREGEGRLRDDEDDEGGHVAHFVRNYKRYPGRSRFFCDGRIMIGPDYQTLALTLFLISAPSVCFAIFDMPFLYANISPAIPFVFAAVWLFCYASLFSTSVRDPGVIPRAPRSRPIPDAESANQKLLLVSKEYPFGSGPLPPLVFYDFQVNNSIVKTKFCSTCRIIRPPRAVHCGVCDACVDRFDHHCPWVANCVGRRNHRYFVCFVSSASVMAAMVEAFTWVHLVWLMNESSETTTSSRFADALRESPISFVLAIVVVFLGMSVGGLAFAHCGFACLNLTTNQQIKANRVDQYENPFRRGCFYDFFYFYLGPQAPSFIQRRAFAKEEEEEQEQEQEVQVAEVTHDNENAAGPAHDIETGPPNGQPVQLY